MCEAVETQVDKRPDLDTDVGIPLRTNPGGEVNDYPNLFHLTAMLCGVLVRVSRS